MLIYLLGAWRDEASLPLGLALVILVVASGSLWAGLVLAWTALL
jgi:hypothetical protein